MNPTRLLSGQDGGPWLDGVDFGRVWQGLKRIVLGFDRDAVSLRVRHLSAPVGHNPRPFDAAEVNATPVVRVGSGAFLG